MKSNFTLIFLLLGVLALAQIPPAPSNLTAFIHTLLAQTDQPVVEFAVPATETNELVFTGQTSLTYSADGQDTLVYVGCTNVEEISWQTVPNVVYRVMVRTNQSPWAYSRIKIIGDGNVFRLYSVADLSRQFFPQPN